MLEQTLLTAAEETRLTEMREELHACGYRDIAEHKNLRVGSRIRHRGQQWPEAFANGTGVVAVLTEKPNSSWSQTYGMPDIELVAVWDEPWTSSRLSQLAQYHVHVIEVADA